MLRRCPRSLDPGLVGAACLVFATHSALTGLARAEPVLLEQDRGVFSQSSVAQSADYDQQTAADEAVDFAPLDREASSMAKRRSLVTTERPTLRAT